MEQNKNKKEMVKKVLNELKIVGIIYLISIVIFKIVFYHQDIINVVRIISSIYFLFILPGFIIMYLWCNKLSFPERFTVGLMMGIAINGLAGYYLSLWGINLKYLSILIPLSIIIIGVGIILRIKKRV